jgi:hypothetical protein
MLMQIPKIASDIPLEVMLVPDIVLDAAVDRDVMLVHGTSCHSELIISVWC